MRQEIIKAAQELLDCALKLQQEHNKLMIMLKFSKNDLGK